MNNRIKRIIEDANISRSDFAKRVEVSQAFVSQMCSGTYRPSARTIAIICREFKINRQWLESGEGPMHLPQPEQDMSYIDILMQDCRSPFPDLVRAILVAYDRASPAGKQAIDDYIQQVKAELAEK